MAGFGTKDRRYEPTGFTRRGLMGTAAAAGIGALAGPAFGQRRIAPSDRVNVAVVGAGGMGADNMLRLTSQNIVATADVDYDHVLAALTDRSGQVTKEKQGLKDAYDKAKRYGDYRKMFDQKDIDAVLIATPDHHHAIVARMAMERGMHVYVQKPLTHTVEESRRLDQLARKNTKLITQMGNQGHSGNDGRRVIELIRGNILGPVREVHVWTNRPVWPQGIPKGPPQTPPAALDWQTWLGPADVDWAYNSDYGHFNWRGWIPFSTGFSP